MSQLVQFTTTGVTEVKTLTGDAGGAVSSLLSNINILGGTNIQTIGTPLTNTININLSGTTDHCLQVGNLGGGITSIVNGVTGEVLQAVTGGDPIWGPITGLDATEILTGFVRLATDAEAIAGAAIVPNNVAIVPTSLKAKLGAQTLHGLPIGAGNTAAIAWTAEPTHGQLLIGSTGNSPVLGTLTAGENIGVANAAGSITIKVDGTTDHRVQVGNATGGLTSLAAGLTGQVLQGFTGGDPIWAASVVADATEVVYGAVRLATDAESIAGAATVPANSAIVPTSLKAKLGTQTLHGLPIGASDSAAITWTAEPSNGQLLIGSTGNAPVLGTLTAGTNIGIANAAGSITIKVAGTTDHAVQVGSGTGDLTSLAVGVTGETIMGTTGANPSWTASPVFGGSVTASVGNITATAGSVSAGTTVVAGTGMTSTTGNIVASAGNISATAGSVAAGTTVTAGTHLISTAGDLQLPASSATQGSIFIGGSRNFYRQTTESIFVGDNAGNFTNTHLDNNGFGDGALANLSHAAGSEGWYNNAFGFQAGGGLTSGYGSCFFGNQAGSSVTTGNRNVCIGSNAGSSGPTTGSYNILIGASAGNTLATTDSSNILIGYNVPGVAGDDNVLRIGAGTGTGAGDLNAVYISGLYNINADSGGTPHALYVGSGNKVGKNPSSRKFKENIVDMVGTEVIYNLRPVNFNYIANPAKLKQWGLIAEEVAEVLPDLAGYDSITGEPDSVRYEMLPVLLLNELKKQQAINKELFERIQALESRS